LAITIAMRALRPALRFSQTLRRPRTAISPLTQPSPWLHPRASIFPARLTTPSPRFYSQQQAKQEETGTKQEDGKHDEGKEDEAKKYAREDTGPPPDPNKSPFQVFVDTFRSELSKSRELQESIKAIQDESGRIGDSEALRKAKEAYAMAKVIPSPAPKSFSLHKRQV
jgi:hypothetical protein